MQPGNDLATKKSHFRQKSTQLGRYRRTFWAKSNVYRVFALAGTGGRQAYQTHLTIPIRGGKVFSREKRDDSTRRLFNRASRSRFVVASSRRLAMRFSRAELSRNHLSLRQPVSRCHAGCRLSTHDEAARSNHGRLVEEQRDYHAAARWRTRVVRVPRCTRPR